MKNADAVKQLESCLLGDKSGDRKLFSYTHFVISPAQLHVILYIKYFNYDVFFFVFFFMIIDICAIVDFINGGKINEPLYFI